MTKKQNKIKKIGKTLTQVFSFFVIVFALGFLFSAPQKSESVGSTTKSPTMLNFDKLILNWTGKDELTNIQSTNGVFVKAQQIGEDTTITIKDQKVGVKTTSPTVALDINGGIKLSTFETCNTDTQGAMRFQDGKFSICINGSWKSI